MPFEEQEVMRLLVMATIMCAAVAVVSALLPRWSIGGRVRATLAAVRKLVGRHHANESSEHTYFTCYVAELDRKRADEKSEGIASFLEKALVKHGGRLLSSRYANYGGADVWVTVYARPSTESVYGSCVALRIINRARRDVGRETWELVGNETEDELRKRIGLFVKKIVVIKDDDNITVQFVNPPGTAQMA
ncbi:MAG: hypothetical protein V1489_00925 [Candidatus Liptonbacteria bacterium]